VNLPANSVLRISAATRGLTTVIGRSFAATGHAAPVDSGHVKHDATLYRFAVAGILVLTILRFVLAATLPLAFDEAYFWLWTKHPAISYYDHPPMMELAIRGGTLLFGDTQFGVRFVPLLASVAASWAVWRSAAILLADDAAAIAACLLFNATLMFAAESMSATPDSLVLAASALLLYAIARLEKSQDGRWWLAAGLSTGIALFSKYTAFFLCVSIVLWLVVSPAGRRWWRSPWLYLGAALACSFLVSTILWNASHDWISFKFQFGRIVVGHATFRFLLEFAAAQLALASPFVLVLGGAGLVRASRPSLWGGPFAFAAAMVWPALIYFLIHAIHSRVQGNWPSFVYPGLILLAAWALTTRSPDPRLESVRQISRLLVFPVAASILAVAYAQGFFGVLAIGRHDPIARMTAVGIMPEMSDISALVRDHHAAAIVTTNYVATAWLAFYLRPHVPIVQITEDYRFLSAPRADPALLRKPLLYVTQEPDKEAATAMLHFSGLSSVADLVRMRSGMEVDRFHVYSLSGFHGAPLGRVE